MSRLAISLLLLGTAFVLAQPAAPPAVPPMPDPRGYVCHRARQPIVIDGKLDDAAWADAPWSEPFVDIEGDAKPAPRYRTRMKMLWDDQCLYVAAELEEPHLWATLTEHDSIIFLDHDFEMFLDPDGDTHNYCELELNAKNTTWDLFLTKPYRAGGKALHAWEILGLKTAVHLDGTLNDPRDVDRGWTVEIAWPWKGLKEVTSVPIPPKDGDQWRVNFSRVEWDLEVVDGKYRKIKDRPEHNWVWSPQGVIEMHRPERWGYLQFSTAKPGTAPFRPDPERHIRDGLQRVYEAQRGPLGEDRRLRRDDRQAESRRRRVAEGAAARADGSRLRGERADAGRSGGSLGDVARQLDPQGRSARGSEVIP